jgi:xanthine/uracil permease
MRFDTFFLYYHLPLFALIGVWLALRIQGQRRLGIVTTLIDTTVIGVAIARLFGSSIPPSGHAIFLTHSLLTIRNRYYKIAALLMLLAVIYLKVGWRDYTSWNVGIVFGLISGYLWQWFEKDADVIPVRDSSRSTT